MSRKDYSTKIIEQDNLSGKPVFEASFLKNVVCKLGTLAFKNSDPYKMSAYTQQ